jgi:hypothetical protein
MRAQRRFCLVKTVGGGLLALVLLALAGCQDATPARTRAPAPTPSPIMIRIVPTHSPAPAVGRTPSPAATAVPAATPVRSTGGWTAFLPLAMAMPARPDAGTSTQTATPSPTATRTPQLRVGLVSDVGGMDDAGVNQGVWQ